MFIWLSRWCSGKESYQCRRCKRRRFEPWVKKIPCRRKWEPTPVFLPKISQGGLKRVRHNWVIRQQCLYVKYSYMCFLYKYIYIFIHIYVYKTLCILYILYYMIVYSIWYILFYRIYIIYYVLIWNKTSLSTAGKMICRLYKIFYCKFQETNNFCLCFVLAT